MIHLMRITSAKFWKVWAEEKRAEKDGSWEKEDREEDGELEVKQTLVVGHMRCVCKYVETKGTSKQTKDNNST